MCCSLAGMDGCLLQDWITISGNDGITSLPQSSVDYYDIGHTEDLVLYLDVRQVAGSVSLQHETAPSKDDNAFLPMVGPFVVTAGLRVDRAFFATAAVPPARFVRWRCKVPGGTWSVTFRIWMATYSWSAANAPPVQCQPCASR